MMIELNKNQEGLFVNCSLNNIEINLPGFYLPKNHFPG